MKKVVSYTLIMLLLGVSFFGTLCDYSVTIYGATVTLSKVYWNPTDDDLKQVDGTILRHKGSDSNSGVTSTKPVRSWEKAFSMVEDGGTIVVMSPEQIQDTDSATVLRGNKEKEVNIERDKSTYTGGEDEIFQVCGNAKLQLTGLTLIPANNGENVVQLKDTATMEIGDEVWVKKSGKIDIFGITKERLSVTAQDMEGKQYNIVYRELPQSDGDIAVGYGENADVENGETCFSVVFQKEGGEIWKVEQREDSGLCFSEQVVYQDSTVYVASSGSDLFSGNSKEKAVKTIDRAIQIIQKQWNGKGTICICDTITIAKDTVWDFGQDIHLIPLSNMTDTMILIAENATVAMKNVYVGDKNNENGVIENQGKLTIATAANICISTLKNQGTCEIKSGSIGLVENKKGTLTIESGEYNRISNEAGEVKLKDGTVHYVENKSGSMDVSGGKFEKNTKNALLINQGTMNVSGGTFSGVGNLISNSGTLNWANAEIKQSQGQDTAFAMISSKGTAKVESGTIVAENGLQINAGNVEIDGANVAINGWIETATTITMSEDTITHSYKIKTKDSKFSVESALIDNVHTQAEAEKFDVQAAGYRYAYVEEKNAICLYDPLTYYVDPVNGQDGNDGQTPSHAWRNLEFALSQVPQDQDVYLYLMESVEVTGTVAYEYTGTGSVTLVAHKNVTGPFFVCQESDSNLTIKNIDINGQGQKIAGIIQQRSGPILELHAGTVTLSGGVILRDSVSNTNGGVIFQDGGSLTVGKAQIKNNTSKENGGAIYCAGGKLEIEEEAVFEENQATKAGGAVAVVNVQGEAAHMQGSYKNNAAKKGGAIYAEDASLTLDSEITGNQATQNGAALYVDESSRITISGGTIKENGEDATTIEEAKRKKISRDIYVEGEMVCNGDAWIGDVIYLANENHPMHITGDAALEKSYVIGYTPLLEGKAVVCYDSPVAAGRGFSKIIEKDYQDKTDEAARPNLAVSEDTVITNSYNVYLKSTWTEEEKIEAQNSGRRIATRFSDACEELKKLGKGNIVICGKLWIVGEETWDFEKYGISWNPEIRIAEECTGTNTIHLYNQWSRLTLNNIVINGNEANVSGCVYIEWNAVFTMNKGSIIKNAGQAGVYVKSGGICNILEGEIKECKSAGIYLNGTVNVTNAKISECEKKGIHNEGGIVTGAAIEITDCGEVGLCNAAGTTNLKKLQIKNCTSNGIYNISGNRAGKIVVGNCQVIKCGTIGIDNRGIIAMQSGEVSGCQGGISNRGTLTIVPMENETFVIYDNQRLGAGGSGGGGIYNTGTCTIEAKEPTSKVIFRQNSVLLKTASSNVGGGALYNLGKCSILGSMNEDGQPTILFEDNFVQGSFNGNSYNFGGGAIKTYASNGNPLILDYVMLSNNYAKSGPVGGAIEIWGKVQMSNCILKQNFCDTGGGAIHVRNGSLVATSCQFLENQSNTGGGALCKQQSNWNGTIEIKNSSFQKNCAPSAGAIARYSENQNGKMSIENSVFIENTATSGDGGAVIIKDDTTIDNCRFHKNIAKGSGGALQVAISNIEIKDCEVTENTAKYGGGISISGSVTVENTNITKNKALYAGGGVSVAGSCKFDTCNITENLVCLTDGTVANQPCYGGGISSSASLSLLNCHIDKNRVIRENGNNTTYACGGGICNKGGSVTMKNSTSDENFVQSNVKAYSGGIYSSGNLVMEASQCNANVTFQPNNANSGNIAVTGAGKTMVMKNSQCIGNSCNGIFVDGAELQISDGSVIRENQGYGILSQAQKVTLNGGVIEKNSAYGVFGAKGAITLNAGGIKITDKIYLKNSGISFTLNQYKDSSDTIYHIVLEKPGTSTFATGVSVIKKSNEVKDVGLYQKAFRVENNGFALEPMEGNLVLSRVYFIGATGKGVVSADTLGATPRNPYTSWKQLKDAIGNKPATIYVCGTIEGGNSVGENWSLADGQVMYRYTGNQIADVDYSDYAFTDGPLVRVSAGNNLTIENLVLDGNKFTDQICNTNASLIEVEKGAKLVLGNGAVIGNKEEEKYRGYDYSLIQNGGTVHIKGTATIQGPIKLNSYEKEDGTMALSSLCVDTSFDGKLVLAIPEDVQPGVVCVSYLDPENVSLKEANTINTKYSLVDDSISLVLKKEQNKDGTQEAELVVAGKSSLYVDGTRSVKEDGQCTGMSPKTAFRTLEQVYEWVHEQGEDTEEYQVYVVGTISLTKGYYSPYGYGETKNRMTVVNTGRIVLKRYGKNEMLDADTPSNQNTVLQIEGNVTLDSLTISGHSKVEWDKMQNQQLQEAVDTQKPVIQIGKNGFLTFAGSSKIMENPCEKAICASSVCRVEGKVALEGGIELIGSGGKIEVAKEGEFVNTTVLYVESPAVDRVLISYDKITENNRATQELEQYTLAGSNIANYQMQVSESNEYDILLKEKQAIYLNTTSEGGSDNNTGDAPQRAVATLKKAYQIAATKNGDSVIYIMNPITMDSDITISESYYQENGTVINLSSGKVSLVRYIADGSGNTSSNKEELICVTGGTLTLEYITLNGRKVQVNGEGKVFDGIDANAPMIKVEESAELTVKKGTQMLNNCVVEQSSNNETCIGAAIWNKGSLKVEGGYFFGNEQKQSDGTKEQIAIYQDGDMELLTEPEWNGEQVYLAENKILQLATTNLTQTVYLQVADWKNNRVILKSNSGELSDEIATKFEVISDKKEYYVARNEKEKSILWLRKKVKIADQSQDVLAEIGRTVTFSIYTDGTENKNEIEPQLFLAEKRVVNEKTTKEDETYIPDLVIGKPRSLDNQIQYKITIPVSKETMGSYRFSLLLDGRRTDTTFTVSCYQWENSKKQPVEQLTIFADKEREVAIHKIFLHIWNGYEEEVKVNMKGLSVQGVDGYEPKVVEENQLSSVDANQSFAITVDQASATILTFDQITALNMERKAMLLRENRSIKELVIKPKDSGIYAVCVKNSSLLNVNANAIMTIDELSLQEEQITNDVLAKSSVAKVNLETKTEKVTLQMQKDRCVLTGAAISLKKNGASFAMKEQMDENGNPTGIYKGQVPAGIYTVAVSGVSGIYQGGMVEVNVGQENEKRLDFFSVRYEKGEENAKIQSEPEDYVVASGTAITLLSKNQKNFIWQQHRIKGWKIKGEQGATLLEGSAYTVVDSIVLEGVWEEEQINISPIEQPEVATATPLLPEPTKQPELATATPFLPVQTEQPKETEVPDIEETPSVIESNPPESSVEPTSSPQATFETPEVSVTPTPVQETVAPVKTPEIQPSRIPERQDDGKKKEQNKRFKKCLISENETKDQEKNGDEVESPRTKDFSPVERYMAMMCCSLTYLIYVGIKKKSGKKKKR